MEVSTWSPEIRIREDRSGLLAMLTNTAADLVVGHLHVCRAKFAGLHSQREATGVAIHDVVCQNDSYGRPFGGSGSLTTSSEP